MYFAYCSRVRSVAPVRVHRSFVAARRPPTAAETARETTADRVSGRFFVARQAFLQLYIQRISPYQPLLSVRRSPRSCTSHRRCMEWPMAKDAHDASVHVDAVGDPFKYTSGPALTSS